MTPDGSTFHTHFAIIFRHIILKNLLYSHIFVNTIQIPPFLTILILTPIPSNSPEHESDPFESFNPHTSIKTIAQPKANLHSLSTYQSIPHSTPLIDNDNLDDTFTSTDSDFQILENPNYRSTSFSFSSTCC